MSHLAPIQEVRTPSPRRLPGRLERLCRTLLLRLFAHSFNKHFTAYLHRWHLQSSILSNLGTTRTRVGLVCRVGTGVKTKIHPPKVEIKSVRSIGNHTETMTPQAGGVKGSLLNASFKVMKGKGEEGEGKRKEEGKPDKPKVDIHRRPISVPPEREEPIAAHSNASNQPNTEVKSLKQSRGKSSQRGNDIGTRLYNQAQEIETKRAEMRKSMEPDYSFTPRLAQNTQKWLSQKTAKLTPMKTRVRCEEVAVVSSSTVIGRMNTIGEGLCKQEGFALATVRVGADRKGAPVTLSDDKDVFLSTEKWSERRPHATYLNRTVDLSSDYASFGPPSRSTLQTDPSPSFITEDSAVFIDVLGEDSIEELTEPTDN